MKSDRVTPEQIEAARRVGTLEYLQMYEPSELTNTYQINGRIRRCKAGEYRTVTHDSLSVKDRQWYWWSRGIGGGNALDYLLKVKDMPFKDAVRLLSGDGGLVPPVVPEPKVAAPPPSEEKKPFQLPERAANDRRVFAYLTKARGIEPEIVRYCLRRGLLYEEKEHHNAVFVGYSEEDGQPLFGCLRSTLDASCWRMDLPGSNKQYSFRMEEPGHTAVMVFEAPIDAMSMASLLHMQGKDWRAVDYLSLGGIAPKALVYYLEKHPEVQRITLALDGDEAGQSNAQKIKQVILAEYPDRKVNTIRPAAEQGKDWNDVLLYKKQREPPGYQQRRSLGDRLSFARQSASQRNQDQIAAQAQNRPVIQTRKNVSL